MVGNRKLLSIAVRSAELTALQFLFVPFWKKVPETEYIADADACVFPTVAVGSGVEILKTCVPTSQQRHCSFSCSSGITLSAGRSDCVCDRMKILV